MAGLDEKILSPRVSCTKCNLLGKNRLGVCKTPISLTRNRASCGSHRPFPRNPFRPGSAGPPPPGGEASPASKEHKVRQRARAKRALGGKGVLVPSGHRSGPTEPAGETGVDESSLASLDLLGQKALADFLRTSDPRSRLANSPKTLCNLVWAAVGEVPLVKPGGAWYNKIPGGEARPEIGGCKGLDGEGGPW